MKAPKWAIEKICIESIAEYFGSSWDAQDFLRPVPETIELNKIYLFGFERTFLCKVESIKPFKYTNGDGTELFDVELKLLVDLNKDEILILPTNDSAKFELRVLFSDLPVKV